MSIGGGPDSDIFRELYKEAYNEGILVVAAAGNDGSTAHDYPASFPHVMSVGAVDQRGKRAEFSNYNDQIEIMAPGVNVMSTAPNDEYRTLSGTSMATPYVAGVAALVWGFFPECSNNQIRNVLALTAKRMTPDGECDEYTGFGLIQAKKAFDALDRWGCEAPGEDPSTLSDGAVGGCGQALTVVQSTLNGVPTLQPSLKSTPKPFGGTDISKDNSCQELKLDLLTDARAYETSWVLERVDFNDTREVIKRGPPSNMHYSPNTKYSVAASGCLAAGEYEFTVFGKKLRVFC
jgi:subtilisin family serine protease